MYNLGELRQQIMLISDDLEGLASLILTINREYDGVKQQLSMLTQGSNRQEHQTIIDGLTAIQQDLSQNTSTVHNLISKLVYITNNL